MNARTATATPAPASAAGGLSAQRAAALRPRIAGAAVVGAIALQALGVFADGTPGAEADVVSFIVICAVIVVAAAIVFGWAVPRALSRPTPAHTALVLSGLALLLVPAFWTGLPPVLAAGGVLLGLAGRSRPRSTTASGVALVVGVLALVAVTAVWVLDSLNTNGVL